jgi:hypothetical protein
VGTVAILAGSAVTALHREANIELPPCANGVASDPAKQCSLHPGWLNSVLYVCPADIYELPSNVDWCTLTQALWSPTTSYNEVGIYMMKDAP